MILRQAAEEIQREFIRGFIRWLGTASEGAAVFEAPGVTASLVPVARSRSIVNCAVFDSAGELESAYDGLEGGYREAGIEAWTVWAPESDEAAEAALAERGHRLDGEPVAMMMDLASFEPPARGDLDWDDQATFAELGRLNDLAYEYEPEAGIGVAMADPRDATAIRLYRARLGGRTASVLGTLDTGTDAGIIFVATPPEVRGRGLASRLLSVALEDAAGRGMQTSSLQASELGAPIYERLGYRTRYRYRLHERRL